MRKGVKNNTPVKINVIINNVYKNKWLCFIYIYKIQKIKYNKIIKCPLSKKRIHF